MSIKRPTIISLLLSWLLLFSAYAFAAPASENNEFSGAACVIHQGKKVVVIHEVITKKLSMPGGGIDSGETPRQAAERETWEETGLVVTAKEELHRDKSAIVFSCVSDSDIFATEYQLRDGFHIVPSWFSPHYGSEVRDVYLVDWDQVQESEYRFPKQYPHIASWLEASEESNVDYYEELYEAASPLHQAEIPYIYAFQQAVFDLPEWMQQGFSTAFFLLNLPGEEKFLYALVPFVFVFFGRARGLTLLFAIVASTVISLLAKQGMSWPRPFVYVPDLKQAEAYGFGMPSGHTMMAATVYGLLWIELIKAKGKEWANTYLPIIIALIFGQAVARVWLGVHFITDTLAGMFLGFLMVWHFYRLEIKSPNAAASIIDSKSFWWGITGILFVLSVVMQLPYLIYMFALVLGVSIALPLFPPQAIIQCSKEKAKTLLLCCVGIGAIFIGLSLIIKLFVSSTLLALGIKSLSYALMPMLVFVLTTQRRS